MDEDSERRRKKRDTKRGRNMNKMVDKFRECGRGNTRKIGIKLKENLINKRRNR